MKTMAGYEDMVGLYHPEDEHDACGVGLIAAIDGKPRRQVVELGIEALRSVWHRGAVNADGKTGDGAGIHLELPKVFFRDYLQRVGNAVEEDASFAVGMIFLPRKDFAAQEEARLVVETEIIRFGYGIYCWRQVPINTEVIGESANASCPEITQIFIAGKADEDEESFEKNLYIIRRRIENEIRERHIQNFYVCSLSARNIIYKGLFLAEQLTTFYPDLNDRRFASSYCIFHQRFSTNTNPAWHLAQPFRTLAHNGEINTLRGNINWMSSYEASFGSRVLGEYADDLIPVVPPGTSDTGALDSVMELFVRSGKSLPMAKLLMIPPAWSLDPAVPEMHKKFFEYCNCLVSPWDGPAAIAATDGRWVLAGMDRGGLRPVRYAVTDSGLLVLGSETGMVPVKGAEVLERGRLGPGEMIAVDLKRGKLLKDFELKDALASEHPYAEWVQPIVRLQEIMQGRPQKEGEKEGAFAPVFSDTELARRQLAAGYTLEEIETILLPMVRDGKEAIGSMGDDTPLAVLSGRYRGLHHYFRQHFSQVTNPPIDPLREYRVMSLITRFGPIENILGEQADLSEIMHADTPILLTAEYEAMRAHLEERGKAAMVDALFDADGSPDALRRGIDTMLAAADAALSRGAHTIFITDENAGPNHCAIPMVLAAGALHTHMVRTSMRKKMSLIARSSATLDVHSLAVLIGVGATAVNPYLAEASVAAAHGKKLFGDISLETALENYRSALAGGLLKIMSKMGISVVSSYRGGRNFDAIGLSRSLVAEFFPGLISRISGIGLRGLENHVLAGHRIAWHEGKVAPLPVGGYYKYRAQGEPHAWEGELIHVLQTACATGSFKQYKRFAQGVYAQAPINLRDVMDFRPDRGPVPLDWVESVSSLRKRFIAPAMSLGALSPEAHETLAVAMNRIGAASNSGEGGEGPERYKPYANGDNANSSIKQVASGRFGVTAEYLNNCREIQIKVAQGAKPGEGGQLPGFKVTVEIARLRHATPGVSLISPPPHHDIYSIEDLAQLIYDLKQINPDAIVSVKLVAQSGIGTIASGVAKAFADKIIIAGHVGGTGASPYSSIKHAGAPWEMGLAETHQVLTLNGLRHRVKLQTDGGLKTGRDIVIAAMLGAEEYAIGTMSLVAMGCILVRQCHSNTCPVGICTQDEKLRKHFDGSVEKVVNLMSFLAEEVREILAELGFKTLDEIVGRSDLLRQVHQGGADLDSLDLGPLFTQVARRGDGPSICTMTQRNEVAPSLDETIIKDAKEMILRGEKIQLSYAVQNTHRSIGTRLSSLIVRSFRPEELQADHFTLCLRGSAGQSLGAFAAHGLRIEVAGDANDYVGKGLSGATIVVAPPPSSRLVTKDNTIIGNTVLYGATSGKLFAAGQAGERFAVRNSGAKVVIEGCGSNGCEYMTGGVAVILGAVGNNFAAGMTGGMAFVYDEEGGFPQRVNDESVVLQRLASSHWEGILRDLVEEHARETGSLHAQNIVGQWDYTRGHFWQVCPKELLDKLEHPLEDAGYKVAKRA